MFVGCQACICVCLWVVKPVSVCVCALSSLYLCMFVGSQACICVSVHVLASVRVHLCVYRNHMSYMVACLHLWLRLCVRACVCRCDRVCVYLCEPVSAAAMCVRTCVPAVRVVNGRIKYPIYTRECIFVYMTYNVCLLVLRPRNYVSVRKGLCLINVPSFFCFPPS